jgi:ferredoxin
MNAVIFYSNTGQSRMIAEFLAEQMVWPCTDIHHCTAGHYRHLVLVFPVYCQNIPDAVKAFLARITTDGLTVVATYGKMCGGNVLYEIQQEYPHKIVAGAYVPTKHAYRTDDATFCAFDRLGPLIKKIKRPSEIVLPRRYKNPLADAWPKLRSRLGIRICRSAACNRCGVCNVQCTEGAMQYGKPGRDCIRCLKCVAVCPQGALNVKIGLPMKLYLQKKKENELILYI